MPARGVIIMAGTLRVRRSQGALSGLLLIVLGIWGALIPFVGPYFHYAYTPDHAWTLTAGRMWLEVLPGAVTFVTGIIVLMSRFRPAAAFASWLAALAGAWFAVGGLVAGHFSGLPSAGHPVGGSARMALEQAGFFIGLGVVIVFLAAAALGRFSVVAVRDATVARPRRRADTTAATTSSPRPPRQSMRAALTKVVPGRSSSSSDEDETADTVSSR
jgi:hypothetical protein